MSRSALIVFARPPVAGKAKTRLTSLLTHAEAAELYQAFLQDAQRQYSILDADVRWYVTEAHTFDWASLGIACHLQARGTLRRKMVSALQETLALGYRRVVIIGSDHPTLPDAYLRAAFEGLLKPPAIALGPTDDGGYYLLGMTEVFAELFREMTYSQPDVYVKTLDRARLIRARVIQLPIWYDIDRPEDVGRLSASAHMPDHTRAVMARLTRKYKF